MIETRETIKHRLYNERYNKKIEEEIRQEIYEEEQDEKINDYNKMFTNNLQLQCLNNNNYSLKADDNPVKSDTWKTQLYGALNGIYFYYMDKSTFQTPVVSGGFLENTKVVGNTTAIENVLYFPYLEAKDLRLRMIGYDKERLGEVPEQSKYNNAVFFRILNYNGKPEKKIGELNIWDNIQRITNKRHWSNESKLYQYPYAQSMIIDYFSSPLVIDYHKCEGIVNDLMVRTSISSKCTYNLFLKGYNGDEYGNIEGMVSNASLDMPCSSSAYNQWASSSKAQYMEGQAFNMVKNCISTVSEVSNNMQSGQLDDALISGMGGAMRQAEAGYMHKAFKQDMYNTPRSIKTMGGDVNFNRTQAANSVDLIRYQIPEWKLNEIGDFFAKYGYMVNSIIPINIRSRYYYNYIKTIDIKIEGRGIPKEDMEELRNIYNKGTTIWHVDREGVFPLDMTYDNREV